MRARKIERHRRNTPANSDVACRRKITVALKIQIDETEYAALDETTRTLYMEGGEPGSYLLDVEPSREAAGLKGALTRTRAERNAARQHAAAVREIDADPTEAKRKYDDAIARATTAHEPMTPAERDAELARLKSAHEAQIEAMRIAHEAAVAPKNVTLTALRLDDALDRAMRAGGVRDTALLMPHLRALVKLESDPICDDVALTVTDKRGNVRLRPDGSAVTVGELLKEWQTLDPSLSRCFHEPTAWRLATAVTNGNGTTH
jgi:hypothetical protein